MVDTGLNRLGLSPEEARSGLLDGLRVETLMSHLACADEPGHPMNERQLIAFRALRQEIPATRYSLANSAGICLGPEYAFGLTRPGLALYGGIPVPGDGGQERGIRPVVSIEAQVVQVRDVPPGGTIGYGATFTAPEAMKLAVLNIGYADGYLRQLAGRGFARLGDRTLPILGRISMDVIAAMVPQAHEVTLMHLDGRPTEKRGEAGMEVAEGDWLAMEFDLAGLAGAGGGLNQYELLTTLGRRYERVWA
jgi:alanine racemase